MRTAIVSLKGIELHCEYEYDPPEDETPTSPPCPAEARLHRCRHKGEDIIEMLTGSQIDSIEEMVIESAEAVL